MADERFFPGDFPSGPGEFPSGLGAAPFFGASSYSYAPPPPPGLDIAAAMQGFGMAWADLQLPDSSSGAAHFDSALSSLVSSPAHNGGGDDVAIGDLIGRLGSICGGGAAAASASNSCYSTPLSSPPRGAAPGPAFVRGCCGYPGAAALEAPGGGGGRLSRVASSKSLGAGAATPASGSPEAEESRPEIGPVGSGSAGTRDPAPPAKKRKASAGKGKATSSAKVGGATEGKAGGDADAAAEKEPAKDYIHVRARRGQATDSHSLAERVRRERISERMKMLQSLVPGSNKITGKALMLDEIINYVQSLQRQVEFLSMKLSTMNPELDADARYQAAAAMLAPPPAAFPSSYAAAAAADSSSFVAAAANPAQPADSCAGWPAQQDDLLLHGAAAARHDHSHGVHAPPSRDGFLHGK